MRRIWVNAQWSQVQGRCAPRWHSGREITPSFEASRTITQHKPCYFSGYFGQKLRNSQSKNSTVCVLFLVLSLKLKFAEYMFFVPGEWSIQGSMSMISSFFSRHHCYEEPWARKNPFGRAASWELMVRGGTYLSCPCTQSWSHWGRSSPCSWAACSTICIQIPRQVRSLLGSGYNLGEPQDPRIQQEGCSHPDWSCCCVDKWQQ